MRRVDSLEKTLTLGGIGGRRRRGPLRMRWLDTRIWMNSGSWWWTGRLGMLRFMGLQRVGHDWVTELNWKLKKTAKSFTLEIKKQKLIETEIYLKWNWSRSVASGSSRPQGLYPTRLCPWNFPGKSTGVGCHFLLQGFFPMQELNLGLLHCRQTLYPWATRVK